jgi:hypothetical protein
MGLKMLHHAKSTTEVKWYLFYRWKKRGGTGFTFPCDAEGNMDLRSMSELDEKIFEACEGGEYSEHVDYAGLIREIEFNRLPAVGLCQCGEELILENFKTTCPKCMSAYTQLGTEVEL